MRSHICKSCNKKFFEPHKETIYCSRKCYFSKTIGHNNQNWKGGRYLSNTGYYYVRAPHDHPNKTSNGYIFEHRILMEKHIGRYLDKTELVHHINGIKSDNRMSNLVVVSKGVHNTIHFKNPLEHCSFDGCKKPIHARSLCNNHYRTYMRRRSFS